MAQQVGSLSVELSASVAAFQRDLGRAATAVDSAAAKMNRSLAAMEKSFRASAAGLQSFIVKGAVAVLGIQSVGSAMRGALNTMRDMGDQAAKLGVHVDQGVARQSAAAARQVDILSFSIKQGLAGAMTAVMMQLPQFRAAVQDALFLEGRSTEDLGERARLTAERLARMQADLREFNLRGQHGKQPGEIRDTRAGFEAQIADAKNVLAQIESILTQRAKDGTSQPLVNDEVYDEWLRNNTMGRDAVYEVVAALKFQEEQLGRTVLQQRVWAELQKADTDLTTDAGVQIMSTVHSLVAQEEALKRAADRAADYDEAMAGITQSVSEAQIAQHAAELRKQLGLVDGQDSMFDDTWNDQVHDAWQEMQKDGEQAWTRIKDASADALTDALMRVQTVGDAARALGMQIAQMMMNRFVATPIFDMIGEAFGFGGARAGGGPVTAGTSYLVGERGPELMTAGSSGHITPLQGSRGGSSRTVIGSINVGQGASVAAVAALQRMLVHVNASIEPRAVAANSAARRRGGGR